MNLFQLVTKNMRQRALSTWLTLLSVTLGVGLAIAIMVMGRETDALFGQKNFGYDVLVGKKGSALQLTINTIYHMDVSPGNIPFDVWGRMTSGDLKKYVKLAVPTVVGDTYQGKYRIVGTLPSLFGVGEDGAPLAADDVMEYKPGQRYEIDQGRVFAGNKFEAIIGSDVSRLSDLRIGSAFQATHGSPLPGEPPEIHAEKWKVVGILKPTHTSADRVIYIPLNSFFTIAAHGVGLAAQAKLRAGMLPTAGADGEETVTTDANGTEHHANYDLTPDGVIHLHADMVDKLALSAIMVQSRGGVTLQDLLYDLNNGTDVMACNPAQVMRDFFDVFLRPTRLMLLIICSLVTVVAAVGILVSIYNSVSARTREIAILRALGATRERILAIICAEASLVAALGCILGIIAGHAITAFGSWYMYQLFGESLHWLDVDWYEPAYLVGVIVLAFIAGLTPAL
ncbi:MAG: FtsX-like permease family protein, partial [Tepidisphaeraceae bacterium]